MKVLVATDLLASMLLHKDYVDGMDILFMWFRKLRIDCGIYAGRTCSNTG